MHWVQALIAPQDSMVEVRRLIPSLIVCPLPQGLALVPLTRQAEQDLGASAFASMEPSPPLAEEMAVGVAALAARLSIHGPVVYTATFIHGGTGGQDALVWVAGELVLSLHDSEENPSQWPNSAISRALRHIGVTAHKGQDEFDAIGLGNHRSNEGWAKAHAKA
jgi:hypothetical protein